jgi:hypothetical protein
MSRSPRLICGTVKGKAHNLGPGRKLEPEEVPSLVEQLIIALLEEEARTLENPDR